MWEYKIVRSQQHTNETWGGHSDFLAKLGEEGWECYAVIPEQTPITLNTNVTYHLKRWRIED